MKKEKKKEMLELQRMSTPDGLVEMSREALAKSEKEALRREGENKKRINELTMRERELKKEIEAGSEILEKMSADFDNLEREQTAINLAELKKDTMTKQDVIDGKITITQYQAQGIEEEEIRQAATAKTTEALKLSSEAIRSKATQVIRDELDLYETQITIHSLMTNPVKFLRRSLQERLEVLDVQIGPLSAALTSAHSLKIQRKDDLLLIQRGSTSTGSGGKVWHNISLQEARRLVIDPIYPEEHISFLLQELSKIEEDEATRLTVTFHSPGGFWPGNPIEIRIEG